MSCWCPVTYINILLVDLIGQQNCCAVVNSAVMLLAVKNSKGHWCVSIRRQRQTIQRQSIAKSAQISWPNLMIAITLVGVWIILKLS